MTQGTKRVSPQNAPGAIYLGLDGIEKNTSRIIKIVQADKMKSSSVRFETGDVLYGRMRPYLNKVTVAPFDGIASPEIIILKVGQHAVPDFIRLRLMSEDFLRFVSTLGKGDRPRVAFSEISKFEFELPPRATQESIVRGIGEFRRRAKKIKERLNRLPRLVVEAKAALLSQALSGDATIKWRTAKAEQRHSLVQSKLDEHTASKSYANFYFENSGPFAIPDSWAWSNLATEAREVTVGHVGPMKDRYVDSTGVPFLRSLNVRPNSIDLDNLVYIDAEFHSGIPKSSLEPGDIVIVRTGAPGTSAVIPNSIPEANCSDLVIARLHPHVNARFVSHCLNSLYVKSIIEREKVGVAQQHFNVASVRKIPIPIPDPEEQGLIADYLDRSFAVLDKALEQYHQACKLLELADARILPLAFDSSTGFDFPERQTEIALSLQDELLDEGVYSMLNTNERSERRPYSVTKRPSPEIAILSAIESHSVGRPSFEEIRIAVDINYETLKQAIFEMLSAEGAKIFQAFDKERKIMVFERVVK